MSRNQKTMMIGGALILVALLLVCGPLSGRFGGPANVSEPPSVAAGPPAGVGVAGAGAAGAIAGAGIGESELAAAGRGVDGLVDETERCRRLENETDEEWRLRLEQVENTGRFDENCARWSAGSGFVGLAGTGAGAAALATANGSGDKSESMTGSSLSDSGLSESVADASATVSDASRGVGRAAAGIVGAGAGIAAGTAAGIGSNAGSAGGVGIGAVTTADLPLATILGDAATGVTGVVTTPGVGAGLSGAGGLATGIAGGLAADTANLAASTFDSQLASVGAGPPGDAGNGLLGRAAGPDGKVVNRFAPPVAAPGGGVYDVVAAAQPFGIGKGNALQPCDNPGSGCRNLQAVQGIPINPPIIPGGRPVPSNPQ